MSAGRADGPQNENALSPNFVRRRAISYRLLSVDRRRRVDLIEHFKTTIRRHKNTSTPTSIR